MVDSSIVDLIVNASGRTKIDADGKEYTAFDPELLRYQLLDVASPNFPAFLRAYKDAVTWTKYAKRTTLPVIGEALAALHAELAENMMISVTGCSANRGDLLRVLTTQRSVQDVSLHDDASKQGLAEKIRNAGGGPQQDQDGGQPDGRR